MNTRILRFGFIIGLVGGGAMAIFAMIAMWATGGGFFTAVNLFAHTFWPDAPIGGTFVATAFALGVLIHLVVSTLVGVTIAWLVEKGQVDAGIIVLLGVGVGTVVWVVQAFAWAAVDSDAQQQFTPWILAVAHLVFALGAATFLTWLKAHDRTAALDAVEPLPRFAEPQAATTPRATRSGFTRGAPLGSSDR